jgi:hypothetical protein
MNWKFLACPVLLAVFTMPLVSQDFGFGDEETTAAGGVSAGNFSVAINGEVSASLLGYVHDFSAGLDETQLGDIFSGKLNFSAGNPFGEAVINLTLSPPAAADGAVSPVALDEAYLRAWFGVFEIEGGLRKLTWGKADSFGPLDVINLLDYTEITDVSDVLNMKIARPLIHATLRTGHFSKLEAVFVPVFEPHRTASGGRWVPARMAALSPLTINRPDTRTLDYAQGGLRFTATIGSSDMGLQYYYGRLPRPAFKMNLGPSGILSSVDLRYNPYHQIGVDYARVIAGFNLRAELAANITEDLGGDDGTVYNPHLAWSAGFDRDLLWGINLNIQCNETIRLLYGNIPDNSPLDMESGTDITDTQVTAILSKKFLRDELELRLAALWEIEAKDFFMMPGLVWTKDAVSVELSGGMFGGDEEGQFGQYHKNSFFKVGITYGF